MRRVALWGLLLGIASLVGLALPDIRRYIRISRM